MFWERTLSRALPIQEAAPVPGSLLAAGLRNGNDCSASPGDSSQACHSASSDGVSLGLSLGCLRDSHLSFQSQARGASVLQELSVLKAHRVAVNFSADSQGQPACFVGSLVTSPSPDSVRRKRNEGPSSTPLLGHL